jgi:hypothetical protein
MNLEENLKQKILWHCPFKYCRKDMKKVTQSVIKITYKFLLLQPFYFSSSTFLMTSILESTSSIFTRVS